MTLNICFLYLLPYTGGGPASTDASALAPKDAPYFLELDIELRSSWGTRQFSVADTTVNVSLELLNGTVWVAECRYQLPVSDISSTVAQNETIQNGIGQLIGSELGTVESISERYTILLLDGQGQNPDNYIEENRFLLARLLRGLKAKVAGPEITEAVAIRTRYSPQDLTVTDWAGAIIIASQEDFQGDIDLLKIGKFQLLRYRMLDGRVQQMLRDVKGHVEKRPSWLRRPHKTIQEIVKQRLNLLLDFEKIDQSLLLIGDWYSAKLYAAISESFCLDQWKGVVSRKLESLEAIHSVVREDLSFSWRRTIDLLVFWGWVLLLIGYIYLFVVDLG